MDGLKAVAAATADGMDGAPFSLLSALAARNPDCLELILSSHLSPRMAAAAAIATSWLVSSDTLDA